MVTVHLIAGLLALLLGLVQLLAAKGTGRHRILGWVWVVTMIALCSSAFFLSGFPGLIVGLSIFHLLSIWTLICLVISLLAIRKQQIARHRAFMVGAYLGTVGAGLGTLAPGRIIHEWLFALTLS